MGIVPQTQVPKGSETSSIETTTLLDVVSESQVTLLLVRILFQVNGPNNPYLEAIKDPMSVQYFRVDASPWIQSKSLEIWSIQTHPRFSGCFLSTCDRINDCEIFHPIPKWWWRFARILTTMERIKPTISRIRALLINNFTCNPTFQNQRFQHTKGMGLKWTYQSTSNMQKWIWAKWRLRSQFKVVQRRNKTNFECRIKN